MKYFIVYNDEVLAHVSAGCQEKKKKKRSCSTGKFDRKAHPSIPSQKFGSFDGCCFSDGVLIDELKRKKYNWSLKC